MCFAANSVLLMRCCNHTEGVSCFFFFVAKLVSVKGDRGECDHSVQSVVILVPRGSAPFSQHQESRPLGRSNIGSLRTSCHSAHAKSDKSSDKSDWLKILRKQILCACSENRTRPEVAMLGAD